MGIFAPLYFVSIGLKMDLISSIDFILVIVVFLIACIGKIIGSSIGIGAFMSGMKFKAALCVGFGMNSRGAIEIIVASTALELKIIDFTFFVALIIMAIFTSIMSGPVIKKN
jgi:Kef-type K+ transport system membrane component KefB